jgi:LuxR family maltose regulon positive regulatory protein
VAATANRDAGHQLLGVKLSVPRTRAPVVRRPRLAELVSRGVQGPLTVVSGPAGSGKSMLLSSWIDDGRAPGPVAWLTLDAGDDEPGVFWAYVLAALRRAGVELTDDVGEPFVAPSVARELLARVAHRLAERADPVVLVVDQFDVVRHREIRADLDFVLTHAAPVLRLVLLTRNAAALRLHRYELRGELVRIGPEELAFTPEEAADLLRQHGVRLSSDGLVALTEHTHGWAAGLRLSAVAMQRRGDADRFAVTLPQSATSLTDYLVDEVLETQPPEIREFLLRTAVVDRICPALADALTDRTDGAAVLRSLHGGNVLTEALAETPGCYRYHPLLTHVLRAELRRVHPDLVPELHRRAALWFEDAGMLVESVRHAVASADWRLAAAVTVRTLGVGSLLAGRESGLLAGELDGLPGDEPGAMPAAVRAARAMTRFDLDACRAETDDAEKLADDEQGDERAALLASTAVLRVILARTAGDLTAAESALADGVAQLERIPGPAAAHPEMLALLLSNAGTVELWHGRYGDAERTLRRGLAISRQPGCEYPRLNILGRLAMVEFHKGRLRRAAQLGQEELAFAEESGLPVAYRTGAGHLALALVAMEAGDRAAARRHIDDAERTVGARHDPFVATIVPLLRAWQHAGARDFRRTFAALDSVPTEVRGLPLPPLLGTRVAMARAAFLMQRGDLAAAEAELAQAPERGPEWAVARAGLALAVGDRQQARELLAPVLAGEDDVEATRIQAWLFTALIEEQEDPAAARDALERALCLARPERHRRVFIEAAPWVRQMLRAFPQLAAEHRWLGPPFVAAGPVPRPEAGPAVPAGPVEPLTERERTVLARMAQAMSTQDIAEDLYVSVNTVKTHQKSIYRKLAVSRRNDAVRRARDLGLV